MNNFVFVVAAINVIFIIAAIFLGKLKKRWPKYIPAILSAAAAIALMIKAYQSSGGLEVLGYFVMVFIALIVFVTALITAVAIEIIDLRKRRAGGGYNRTGPDSRGSDGTPG